MEKSDRHYLNQAIKRILNNGTNQCYRPPDVTHRGHNDSHAVFSQKMFNLDLNVRKQIRLIQVADTTEQMVRTLLSISIMKNEKAGELTRNAYVRSQKGI